MTQLTEKVKQANQKAVATINSSETVFVGIDSALKAIPNMAKNVILTSGALTNWDDYYGGQRRAVLGGAVYEGLASDFEDAEKKIRTGDILVKHNHDHGCVGDVTGVCTASMPVVIVENRTHGNRAFSNLFETSSPKRLNFGAYDQEVHDRLVYLRTEVAPLLNRAIGAIGGVEIKPIVAKALKMGDELHSKHNAAMLLFVDRVICRLLDTDFSKDQIRQVRGHLSDDLFFLRLSMASAKATMDPVRGLEHCSVVSTLCFDCANVNIRVAGLGDRWFSFSVKDSLDTLYQYTARIKDQSLITFMGGESTCTEAIGLGGFAQVCAPTLQDHQGGSYSVMERATKMMYEITAGESDRFLIPALGFRGVPTGIDVFKVCDTKILPVIDAGIGSKDGGKLGAGTILAPLGVFELARDAFLETYPDVILKEAGQSA